MEVQQATSVDETAWKYGIQEERGLDSWREQVDQARRSQVAARILAQESANAYREFLDSLYFYYWESVRAAEEAPGRGS
jgi:hypothetical protein